MKDVSWDWYCNYLASTGDPDPLVLLAVSEIYTLHLSLITTDYIITISPIQLKATPRTTLIAITPDWQFQPLQRITESKQGIGVD